MVFYRKKNTYFTFKTMIGRIGIAVFVALLYSISVNADLTITSSVADFDAASGLFSIQMVSTNGQKALAMFNLGGNRVNTHTVSVQTDGPFDVQTCIFQPIESELYIQSGVKIVDSETMRVYYCSYNGWLGVKENDKIEREPLKNGKEYAITLNTADVPKAGRKGRLNMRIHGSRGSTPTDSFFVNVKDKSSESLSFYSEDIGLFESLYLYVDGEDALLLDNLIVKCEGVDTPAKFEHKEWLNPNCPYVGHGSSHSFIMPPSLN
eukprot:CFRG6161T1